MIRKVIVPLLFSLLCVFSSNGQTASIDSLKQAVQNYVYHADFDSAQTRALEFLSAATLSPEEEFFGKFYLAEAYRAGGKSMKAVEIYADILPQAKIFRESALYTSSVFGAMAEAYFDHQSFDLAYSYARKSVDSSPDTSLRVSGHAINHLIMGYVQYRWRNFAKSREYYLKAGAAFRTFAQECELPLYHTKMALLYDKQEKTALADAHIDSSRALAIDCKIDNYLLLTERTALSIFLNRGDYKSALEKSNQVNRFVQSMNYEEQQKIMSKLEENYSRRLQDAELQNLRDLNEKNAEIIAKRSQLIWFGLFAIFLLSILLIILYRVNYQRKRAFSDLETLNYELEEKVETRTHHLAESNALLALRTKELEQRNAKLIDLYYIIAHDLSTPLSNITMLVKLIVDSTSSQEKEELIKVLLPAVNNLNHTCGELLDTVQFAQNEDEEWQSLRFTEVLEKVKSELKAEIENSGAAIEVDLNVDEIEYPLKNLESVLRNLISNALKYRSGERPPLIKVQSLDLGEFTVVKVSDNGLGIDLEKYGDKIFQAKQVFHDHPEAKGYGLYMTKQHLQNMGGDIRVESTPGEGTTFTVFLRRSKPQSAK